MPLPDVTERIVNELSSRTTVGTWRQQGAKYDIAIDDLPFVLATAKERPYVRATAETRRQQIDTSAEPGEQTLSQWWTRSQDSWHRGAGIGYYEPGSDETTQYRYADSVGVNPWVKGELTLHRRTSLTRVVNSGQSAFVTGAVASGVNVMFTVETGVVYRHDGSSGTTYTNSTGKTPATAVVKAGSKILVGHVEGILIGDVTGSSLATKDTITSGAVVTPHWVKSRIIATRGHQVYELTLASTGAMPDSPLFAHVDSSWTWTGVVETPDAILLSGYSAGYGAIYRVKLVDAASAGGSPTLGTAEIVAEFPSGEEVHSIHSYLGSFLGIGTSKGIRVGIIGSGGQVNYGPLLVETVNPVRGWTARDRFLYAGVQDGIEGKSGVIRIDLQQQPEELRFAYATDYQTKTTGVVTSVAHLGMADRVAVAVTGKGVYLQSGTHYEASGWIKTGKIRLATTVGKSFPLAQLRATATSTSSVGLATVVEGVENFEFSVGSSFNTEQNIALSTADRVLPNLELKLTLNSSTNNTVTPVVDALTLRAIPRPAIQREIQMWLNCFDFETDRNNVKVGRAGSAWDRLSRLEGIEKAKALVNVKDTRSGENFRAWISRIEFMNTQPPDQSKDNYGGHIRLSLVQV